MLLYAHYFYPEVASTAQILTDLCQGLKDEFLITVVCTVPSYVGKIDKKYKQKKYYFENYEGIKLIRVRVKEFQKKKKISRLMHILSYFWNAIFATFKVGHQDIVFAISQPPILGGILGNLGRIITKGKFIYNIQDFNPEQIMAVKYSKNKFLLKCLLWLDKHSCQKADLIITVGYDMQKTLEKRFFKKKVPQNVVIHNWINEREVYPLEKTNKNVQKFQKKFALENKFVIMYSGNLGLYYDLENLIKVFQEFKEEKEIVFVFVGDGSLKEKLEQYAFSNKLDNITFIPYQEKKNLIYSLNSANIHLVTNAKGIKGISVPSKIYGCLATNIPIFGIVEKGSEAWNIIKKSNCGILSSPEKYEDIKQNLQKIILEKEEFVNQHKTGRKYLEENFTKDKAVHKYLEEIKKLIE